MTEGCAESRNSRKKKKKKKRKKERKEKRKERGEKKRQKNGCGMFLWDPLGDTGKRSTMRQGTLGQAGMQARQAQVRNQRGPVEMTNCWLESSDPHPGAQKRARYTSS